MGIRLNIVDNPAMRAGFGPMEPVRPDVAADTNRAALRTPQGVAQNLPRPGTEAVAAGNMAAPPADNATNGVRSLLMANRPDEDIPADRVPPSIVEANAEANRTEEANGAAAPRLRDFRFLTAAESMRERELETRHDQLEQRLEATSNRLELNDSVAVRIDARLQLARLERDLDLVSSEIRRLRLERAFAQPTGQAAQPAEAAASESPENGRVPTLNLLA